jgi:hypothetical protein
MKDFNGKVVVTDKSGAEGVHEKSGLICEEFLHQNAPGHRRGTGSQGIVVLENRSRNTQPLTILKSVEKIGGH